MVVHQFNRDPLPAGSALASACLPVRLLRVCEPSAHGAAAVEYSLTHLHHVGHKDRRPVHAHDVVDDARQQAPMPRDREHRWLNAYNIQHATCHMPCNVAPGDSCKRYDGCLCRSSPQCGQPGGLAMLCRGAPSPGVPVQMWPARAAPGRPDGAMPTAAATCAQTLNTEKAACNVQQPTRGMRRATPPMQHRTHESGLSLDLPDSCAAKSRTAQREATVRDGEVARRPRRQRHPRVRIHEPHA